MKKIIFAVMIVCVMCSGACAVSEDMSVYVRRDVFDAKMEMLFTRLEGKIDALDKKLSAQIDGLDKKIDAVDKKLSEKIDGVDKKLSAQIDGVDKKLSAQIDGLDKKIDGVDKKLSARIDGVEQKLSAQINGLDKRVEDTHNFLYLILVFFGAIFLMPFVSRFWELHMERRTPAVTLEDVQRIVTEAINANNAKIRG